MDQYLLCPVVQELVTVHMSNAGTETASQTLSNPDQPVEEACCAMPPFHWLARRHTQGPVILRTETKKLTNALSPRPLDSAADLR